MNSLVDKAIETAIKGTRPRTLDRMNALASVRWVLATEDSKFVKIGDDARAALTSFAAEATVYDGRDNEVAKCRFFQALFCVPAYRRASRLIEGSKKKEYDWPDIPL